MAKKKEIILLEQLEDCADYEDIKKDLLAQLKENETNGMFYTDMIEDYMDMWLAKNLLINDIKTRGVTVRYNNGGGQSGYKKNESVEQLLKVNTQMLKILESIGIKPNLTKGGGDGDEPL